MDLQFPIGKYIEQPFSDHKRREWLLNIQALPHQLEQIIENLDESMLNTAYREGGWSPKQVVHHVADSHMNAYIRFKLALTEDSPVIKPYNQDLWVTLPDVQLPVNLSLTILYALHARWYEVLQSITPEQFRRTLFHPEYKKEITLWYMLGNYAWHGLHHVAHIQSLRTRMGW